MLRARDALLRLCIAICPSEPHDASPAVADAGADAGVDAELAAATRMPDDTTLVGLAAPAKVVDVHDGDTVRLVVRRAGRLEQYVCRLAGIDAPELHPRRSAPDRERTMGAARAARDRLRGLILNTIVDAAFGRPDKYGRQLVTLTTRAAVGAVPAGTVVNDYMVRAGLAVAYDGGRKA